jgi:predicted transcriptional regulator
MKERRRKPRLIPIRKIIDLLDCEILWGSKLLSEEGVTGCFAADLMSDVLAFSKTGVLLLTGLTSVQSVHTADVAELKGVVYVSNKKPSDEVLEAARKKEIPLLRTSHNLFDACGILFEAGVRTKAK